MKIGARIVRRGHYDVFQMAKVAVPRAVFARILKLDRRPAASTTADPDMTKNPRVSLDPAGKVRSNPNRFAFASRKIALTAANPRVRLSRAVQESPLRLLHASNKGTLAIDLAPTGQYRLTGSG